MIINKTFVHQELYVELTFLMLCGKDEQQTKQNLNRFATEIKKLGVDTTKGFNAALDQLPNFIDTECKITITTTVSKQGNEFVNTSFDTKEKRKRKQEKCIKKIIFFLLIFAMCSLMYIVVRDLKFCSRED